MRGYFASGAEGISNPMNRGARMRSAHACGAVFVFTVEAAFNAKEAKMADTADAAKHLPLYTYSAVAELALPRGCALVGVELTEDAVELPSFYHPQAAAYVLGRERGSLSPALQDRCDYLCSEAHTSELPPLMRISYAVLCLNHTNHLIHHNN